VIPLCPALMQGHAASLATANAKPADCMPLVTDGSACLGSRCAKWVPELGALDPSAEAWTWIQEPGMTNNGPCRATGRGGCADNVRRAPFADPAAPTPTPETTP
jgi:hypothetical protein